MSEAPSNDMVSAPVVRTFFRYSLPWTLSFLILSSAGIIDGIFIGRCEGPLALAGVNIVWPVFSVFMGASVALAAGGAVRCSAYLARNEVAEAKAIFTKCIASAFLVSLFLSFLCLAFTENIVAYLGADATTAPYSIAYLQSAALFFPFLLVGYTLSYFLRVDERPNLASAGLVVTAAANIALDYVFIAHFGLGVQGAAFATGSGYLLMFFVYLVGFFLSSTPRRLYLTKAVGEWKEVAVATWNGISEMINEISTGLVIIFINIAVMRLEGAYGVAAFTVVNYMNWFCLVLSYGFADSLAPIISANHSCQLHQRTRAFLRVALLSVFVVGVACFSIMSVYAFEIVGFFIEDNLAIAELAQRFMNISRFMYFFCGMNIVLTAYLTGLMQASASATVAICRALLFPLFFIAILSRFYGFEGVALAMPLSEGLCFIVAMLFCYKLSPVLQKDI